MKHKLSDAQETKLTFLYQNKKISSWKLAAKFKLSQRAVLNILIRHNISRRDSHKRKLTSKQEKQIVKEYLVGSTTHQLAEKYKVVHSTVCKIMCRNGGVTRKRQIAHRKYSLNDFAFNNITKEATAYWVGFLMADGCVSYYTKIKQSPRVILSLQERDSRHIEKFQDFIGSNHPICHHLSKNKKLNKAYPTARLSVSSIEMANQLKSFGVVPQKTYKGEFKQGLQNNKHCWRGLFDGDGSLGISQNRPYFCLLGTKALMEQFAKFVFEQIGFEPRVWFYHAYTVSLGGQHAVKMIKVLYNKSSAHLTRKKRRATKILKKFGYMLKATRPYEHLVYKGELLK